MNSTASLDPFADIVAQGARAMRAHIGAPSPMMKADNFRSDTLKCPYLPGSEFAEAWKRGAREVAAAANWHAPAA